MRKNAQMKEVIEAKTKLFASLMDYPVKNPPTILEVGAAECYNFRFYPDKSKIILTEPNVNFHDGIRKNAAENGSHVKVIDVLNDVAENLKSIDDASMDAYVLTHVMCSVNDVNATLSEAKRVLKKVSMAFIFAFIFTLQTLILTNMSSIF